MTSFQLVRHRNNIMMNLSLMILVILLLGPALTKTEFHMFVDTYPVTVGRPDIRFEGVETRYLCRTMVGKSTPTLIFEQKRRDSESWGPVLGDMRLHRYVKQNALVYAKLQFKADSKLHNGTTFRCLAKENPIDPEPALFDPIVVHNLATARYYNVSITRNAETKRLTCDPPANVQKESNDKWIVSVLIVNSIRTDYRGTCLINGKRFIDIRRRDLDQYDELSGKNNVNTHDINANAVNANGTNANGVNTNGGSGNGVNVAGGAFGGLFVFLLYTLM
ncbi:uncharacterized protein LOC141906756 isoform X2 [Tubulanus polymorphus]|uniref:uncharacterized protein LOC141906756 isoform X2 n=1 Tax=Tubulanus polymorphus TaxID=672921 RepID=UPI003DA27A3D